jgi:acyl-coenzyme A synthetase/AMP-(fatty) acid ligase
MAEAGITVLNATPTLLRGLMAADWPGDPDVMVLSGGEALDQALAAWIGARAGELGNVYGPTEATVWATAHRHDPSDEAGPVSIGRPLPGYRVYLLDAAGRFVPPGSVGELWIGGPAVARGYRNQPQRTSAVFTADPLVPGERRYATGDLARWPPDGNLEFLGRRDQQVKIRGYRVELGEIEAVVREHPAVTDAAVLVSDGPGDPHLVGYLAGADIPSAAAVEQFLRDRLPDYAVPRQWTVLPELPTLPSGKVDRQALGRLEAPAPQAPDTPLAGDSDGTEGLVLRTWAEVLERPGVCRDDDFFKLGGHSFAATVVIGRLRTALDRKIPVRLIFDRPVAKDFTAAVDDLLAAESRDA